MIARELRGTDREALAELVLSVYDDSPEAMLFRRRPTRDELSTLFSEKLCRIELGTVADFVAEEDGRIVGECEAVLGRDGTGKIGIIVGRGHRGRGIGAELLRRCMGKARELGARSLEAEVNANNAAALKLFSKEGFADLGERDGIRVMGKDRVS